MRAKMKAYFIVIDLGQRSSENQFILEKSGSGRARETREGRFWHKEERERKPT